MASVGWPATATTRPPRYGPTSRAWSELSSRGSTVIGCSGIPLGDHPIQEPLRRPLAPLRDQPVLGRDQVGAVLHVQPIGVRPVLVYATPRIRPVVVDLAAEEMASDAPHVLVLAELRQVLVAGEHVVDVGDLERQVIEPGALVLDAEEHVMVDVRAAAVAAVERPDDVVL